MIIREKRKYLGLIGICIVISLNLQSQDIELSLISSNSGFYKSTDMYLSWSVGEIIIESFSSGNLLLTQGFQQPFDFKTVINRLEEIDAKIKIYPNPTSKEFRIELPFYEEQYAGNSYQMLMYDVNSKLVKVETLNQSINRIDIQNYLSGIYLIKIFNKNSKTNEIFILQKINK